MELKALKAQTDSLCQLLWQSPELAALDNGPQIAATVDGLVTELLRVIGQLQQDVAAIRAAKS